MADTFKIGGLTVIQAADVLDPAHPINTEASSQFNRQSGLSKVAGNMYLQQNADGSYDLIIPTDEDADGNWVTVGGSGTPSLQAATRSLATGLIDPANTAQLTINADPSRFDVSVGKAQFVDAYTDAGEPASFSEVEFGPFTAQTLDQIGVDSATFLYVDVNGALVQKRELQGGEFLRDHAGIGIITHPASGSVITGVTGFTPVALANTQMALADLSFCMGAINCATGDQNVISGNSGTLGLDKAQGCWYYFGINARGNSKNPSIVERVAWTKPTMFIGWTVTDNPEGKLIAQDTIPAGVSDDGTAVLADALPQGTVTTNNWVNNRVYIVVDEDNPTGDFALAVQIGPASYNSAQAAIDAMPTEDFNVLPVLQGTTPIATVTMRGAAADLSLAGDANIRQANPPRATHQ